jgi:hypothetical protein
MKLNSYIIILAISTHFSFTCGMDTISLADNEDKVGQLHYGRNEKDCFFSSDDNVLLEEYMDKSKIKIAINPQVKAEIVAFSTKKLKERELPYLWAIEKKLTAPALDPIISVNPSQPAPIIREKYSPSYPPIHRKQRYARSIGDVHPKINEKQSAVQQYRHLIKALCDQMKVPHSALLKDKLNSIVQDFYNYEEPHAEYDYCFSETLQVLIGSLGSEWSYVFWFNNNDDSITFYKVAFEHFKKEPLMHIKNKNHICSLGCQHVSGAVCNNK